MWHAKKNGSGLSVCWASPSRRQSRRGALCRGQGEIAARSSKAEIGNCKVGTQAGVQIGSEEVAA
jgi:hypothetical protein